MEKNSKLDMVINDLRNAATIIKGTADTLTEMFGNIVTEETVPAPPDPELTLTRVIATLAEMSRWGHTTEIRPILWKNAIAKLVGMMIGNIAFIISCAVEYFREKRCKHKKTKGTTNKME